ncbi:MAG: DUF3047 domain-containing protein [Deltaproteobacteria bacterium]
MIKSEISRPVRCALFALIIIAALASPSPGADPESALSAAGWAESSSGRWNSLPERRVEARGGTLKADFVLSPGSGVEWDKKGGWDPSAGAALSFEFTVDGTNRTSDDYREFKARFPFSVTAVFGDESQRLTWRKRVGAFFRRIWNGFPPAGIRLTYACGNVAPVGSMYRTDDEETVFILAGEDDKGRKIQAKRNLKEDFLAAYGRDPKGLVTRIIVRAQRPSKEKGGLKGSAVLTLP